MTAFPADLLAQILTRAAAASAEEVCGLLFGSIDRVDGIEHTANVCPNAADSFEVDPARLLAAMRAERSGGPRLVGHYHSHPNGVPEPSVRDRAAAEPGRLWLIVGGGAVRLWLSHKDGFRPLPLVPV